MKNYSKIFKLSMWVLIAVSVILLVLGFITGFETNGGAAVETLLYWTYVMIALAAIAVIGFGIAIAYKNNPKSILKGGIVLVAIAAVCFLVYLVSPGKPAMGMLTQPTANVLKLTDTMLNLTYIAGGLAIVAIIAGEIIMSARNKK